MAVGSEDKWLSNFTFKELWLGELKAKGTKLNQMLPFIELVVYLGTKYYLTSRTILSAY